MRLVGPLLVVEDIQRSRAFYETLLLQQVRFDLGENQQFESGLMLQSRRSWSSLSTIPEEEISPGAKNVELYFETETLDDDLRRVEAFGPVRYVHPLRQFDWGQRSAAFYDPDRLYHRAGRKHGVGVPPLFAGGEKRGGNGGDHRTSRGICPRLPARHLKLVPLPAPTALKRSFDPIAVCARTPPAGLKETGGGLRGCIPPAPCMRR